MAREGFVPNFKGYREVLTGDEAYHVCDSKGRNMCQEANMAGHGEYTYDTIHGKGRVHTRVKTANSASFYKERKTNVLRHIATRGM